MLNNPSVPTFLTRTLNLDNGLRVVLSPDRHLPLVSLTAYYDLSPKERTRFRQGIPHIMEHLAFMAVPDRKKAKNYLDLVSTSGCLSNALTNEDFISFYTVMPSSFLPIALEHEARRMTPFRPSDDIVIQVKDIVRREREFTLYKTPYIKGLEKMYRLCYESMTSSRSIFGTSRTIRAVKLADLLIFHKTFFSPNNAVLSIVGDYKEHDISELIEGYFGAIQARSCRPISEIELSKPGRLTVKTLVDRSASVPYLHIAFNAPVRGHEHNAEFHILEHIINNYDDFVRKRKVLAKLSTAGVSAQLIERRFASIFIVFALAQNDVKITRMLTEIIGLIRNVTIGLSRPELEAAKRRVAFDFCNRLVPFLNRARYLSECTLYGITPEHIYTEFDHFQDVTRASIQLVIDKYLDKKNAIMVFSRTK